MPEADDLFRLSDSLWLWQAYDPAVKCDLFSSAARIGDQLYLVDPIPLSAPALTKLTAKGKMAGILITNANHPRAAVTFAKELEATIFSAAAVAGEFGDARAEPIAAGELSPGLQAIAIEGAAGGEMAFHIAAESGTLVMGDALINFEPSGFALLPPKYCSNQKQMRRSLRQLLDLPFERLLFAHGTPILSGARARLETLLR